MTKTDRNGESHFFLTPSAQGLLLLCLILVVLPLACCSCAKVPGPDEVLRTFSRALVEKNWEVLWSVISSKSQQEFDEKIFQPFKAQYTSTPQDKKEIRHPLLGVSIQDVLSMSAKDFFILNCEKTQLRDDILKTLNPDKLKIENVSIKGDVALVKIEGRPKPIKLYKEKGKWKIYMIGE
jgi:hypothetical protein